MKSEVIHFAKPIALRKGCLVLLPTFQHIRLVFLTCRQDQNSTRAQVKHHKVGGRQLCKLDRMTGEISTCFEARAIDVGIVGNLGQLASWHLRD